MKKPTASDNKITLMPNTTKYEVVANSDIGKKILASDVGVVIHKAIGLDGTTSDVDMGQFQQGATMIMPPVTMQKSPGVDIPQVDELENYLNQNAKAIDDLFNVPAELKMKNFGDILYSYINASVKNKSLDNLGAYFVQWVEGSNLSGPKKERLLDYVNTKAKGFNATFNFIKGIKNIKNKVIELLDNQKADIQAVQDGEGYVVDKDVKLVNRSTFHKQILQGIINERRKIYIKTICGYARGMKCLRIVKIFTEFINPLGEARMFRTRDMIQKQGARLINDHL